MKTIVLCYRKVIDANTLQAWEQMVYEDSYTEFKLQFQNLDKNHEYHTYAELLRNLPNAEQLNFLISPSIVGYLRQLQERIPDVVNILGKHFLNFKQFRFELINSDIRTISKHKIAVSFYSEPMIWLDTIGNHLLLAERGQAEDQPILTHLFPLQPFVNIHSLQQ
ncbi:hypothetical protein DBR11_25150 [Pedobacter sp. HMWF019]|uniref:hypothetical protein n=1 Tax=Pedobacter sp. HMWF019 TaxID=2056856 RepID=UPI000D3945BF|nr:hypothetical protein [Pedobacter sp. HMWF019]PTS93570.1 hypothetical protein DBR11_25150 [Pedobacter sp. HMWF019]